jgi:hypothetical protein
MVTPLALLGLGLLVAVVIARLLLGGIMQLAFQRARDVARGLARRLARRRRDDRPGDAERRHHERRA